MYRKFYLLDTKISSRSGSAATCKTVLPVAIVNGYKPLTIAIKNSISHIAALPDPSVRSICKRYLLPMNFNHRMRPHENTCNDVHSENPATNQKTWLIKKCSKIKLTRKGVDKMATQTQTEIYPKYNKKYLILVILVRAIVTQCKSYC